MVDIDWSVGLSWVAVAAMTAFMLLSTLPRMTAAHRVGTFSFVVATGVAVLVVGIRFSAVL